MAKLTREQVEEIVEVAWKRGKKPNLNGADLSWASLIKVELFGANLRGANLQQVNLNGADLRGTDLHGAKLSGADLSEANLRMADLSRADLFGANLRATDLRMADLTETDLTEALIGNTTFAGVDLRNVRGLDSVQHQSPSFIDIHTIYRSHGKIPEAFLRGIGAPDTFITYVASLTGEAIQYYSCFISYSSQDTDFAQRLHADLQQKGVRCWFAPEDMKIGDKIRARIDESIRIHDKLLVVLSGSSVNSIWVEKEVETAFEEENRRSQTVLFPVRLDEAVMDTRQPWAADIRRTRHIGDFRRWKEHDSYQRAFERLLRDLKAEEAPIVPERFAAAAQPSPAGRVESLRRQLARHTANRDKLREEIAVFAVGERPLHLRNQIEDEEREISRLEAELAELDGADRSDGNS